MGKLQNASKTVRGPRRPYDRERIDRELQLVGRYGLRNKREVWRAQLALATVRKKARTLLILDERDPKRIFEGNALLRRLVNLGIVTEENKKLDNLLSLTIEQFLDRRLQTRVFKLNAKSIHHARVLVRQRHMAIGKRMVNVPSFMVSTESERFLGYVSSSPMGGGRPGRRARKTAANAE